MFRFSLLLNLVFILVFTAIAFKYKEKIIDVMIGYKGEAEIVMFGNSITARGNWNALLNRNDVKNSGIDGFTTSHFVLLIKSQVVAYKPKICFLEGGINDIMVGIPVARIKSNYISLIDVLIKNNIKPIVQSTLYQENNPQSKIQVDSLNNFLFRYCKEKDIVYLDINSELSTKTGLKPKYSLDGTHINNEAYKVWANEISKVLRIHLD